MKEAKNVLLQDVGKKFQSPCGEVVMKAMFLVRGCYFNQAVSVPLRGSGDESPLFKCLSAVVLIGVVSVPLRGSGDESFAASGFAQVAPDSSFSPLAGKW